MSDNKFQAALKAAPTVNMSAAEAEALPELTLDDAMSWSGKGSHLNRWPGKFPESKQQKMESAMGEPRPSLEVGPAPRSEPQFEVGMAGEASIPTTLNLDSDDGEYFSERMGGGPRKVSPRYLRDAGDRVNRHAQDLGFPAQYSAPPGLHEEVVAWEEAAIADLNRRAALKPTLAQKINKALFPQDWE